jgi:hypothetical protein
MGETDTWTSGRSTGAAAVRAAAEKLAPLEARLGQAQVELNSAREPEQDKGHVKRLVLSS